jgi:hypothetical protein
MHTHGGIVLEFGATLHRAHAPSGGGARGGAYLTISTSTPS